jgi:hypothetical protein
MVSGNLFLTAGRNMALKIGEFFVTHFIYAKPGHPNSLEIYLEGVRNYPGQILKFLSFGTPSNIWMLAMSVFCAVLLTAFLRKKIVAKSLLGAGIFFLVVDLYAASFLDIQLDLASYKKTFVSSPILGILEQEKAAGHVGRVYGFRSVAQKLPLIPSKNMLYGIEDIGMYSPLVSKRYFESIGLLGNVNDSNYQRSPSPDFVLQRLPLLGFLDVSHILSSEPLDHPDLKFLGQDSLLGSYLYKNMGIHQRAYFVSRVEIAQDWNDLCVKLMAPRFDPKKMLLLEEGELVKIKPFAQEVQTDPVATIRFQNRTENFEDLEIEVSQTGFLVISETFYAGWDATVNDQPAPILKADGLFRAIRIGGPGSYKIQFRYKPFSRK